VKDRYVTGGGCNVEYQAVSCKERNSQVREKRGFIRIKGGAKYREKAKRGKI
jgi:hypothetical protein